MKLKTFSLICALMCVIAVIFSGCTSSIKHSEGSILGTWSTKSPAFIDAASASVENVVYYYTFEEGGRASVTTGTFSIIGKWYYIDSDGNKTDTLKDKVKIDVQTMISGTFSAEVKAGSKEKFTLKLSDNNGVSMTLKSSELPETKNKVAEDFKEVDYITGKWQSMDNDEVIYIFNSDGTCKINQTGLTIDGTYTVDEKNKIIELTYLEQNRQNSWNIPFIVKETEKGQKITFANSVFTKV